MKKPRIGALLALLLSCWLGGMTGCQLEFTEAAGTEGDGQQMPEAAQSEPGVVIENESDLPETYPRATYEVRFRAHGGVPVLHWRRSEERRVGKECRSRWSP